jgi:putative membrane protein
MAEHGYSDCLNLPAYFASRETMVKHWVRAILSIAFILGGAAHGGEISHGDRRFMEEAAQAGTFEIEASELAARNAENDEVQRYARMMIKDHTGVGRQLESLAEDKKVDLPKDLRMSQARDLKALQAESGRRFDLDYADKVAIAAHGDAIKLFVEAAERAQDPDVKAFAQQTLPGLKAHLDAGIALRKSLAASGKASPEESRPSGSGVPGSVSPASREAPPSLMPGDKGAPKPQ